MDYHGKELLVFTYKKGRFVEKMQIIDEYFCIIKNSTYLCALEINSRLAIQWG